MEIQEYNRKPSKKELIRSPWEQMGIIKLMITLRKEREYKDRLNNWKLVVQYIRKE